MRQIDFEKIWKNKDGDLELLENKLYKMKKK